MLPFGRRLSGRSQVVDLGTAVLLDAVTAAPLLHRGGAGPGLWLLDQALVLPLALRRRCPLPVFAVVAVLASLQWAVGARLPADVALLVALYTVAAHEPRRRAVGAAAVLEAGVVLASVRFAPTGDGVVGSLVFLSGLVAAAFFLGTTLQTRRDYLASLEDRARRLERERDQQALLAATAERARIAREMHDIVAHHLSIMITLADGASLANRGGPPAASEAMAQVSATGRQALAEMREVLGVLREEGAEPELEPQPELDRIESVVAQVRAAGLPVRLTVTGQPRPLPRSAELAVYRLVQEALSNALQHARAATGAQVALRWREQDLSVVVRDDGQGGGAAGPGHGLTGMRERFAVYGGSLQAGPAPGGGWRVAARMPLVRGVRG